MGGCSNTNEEKIYSRPVNLAPRWPTALTGGGHQPSYLQYLPAESSPDDLYPDRTHRRKVESPSSPYQLTATGNRFSADGRPDVRPVYRPPQQSAAVAVNSKAVNGLQRPLPPPAVAGHQTLSRPLDYFPLQQQQRPLPPAAYSPQLSWQAAAAATTATPDTRWYRGDYQDAFRQTHEYYNLDVVASPAGEQQQQEEEDEYEYYEDDS